MNNEEMRKMWEAAASRSSFTPPETHILNIRTRAKDQGRELTADENATIARHRQNAVDAARRSPSRSSDPKPKTEETPKK